MIKVFIYVCERRNYLILIKIKNLKKEAKSIFSGILAKKESKKESEKERECKDMFVVYMFLLKKKLEGKSIIDVRMFTQRIKSGGV